MKDSDSLPTNGKPFAVHHNDYGIFSELCITNIGGEAVIAGITVNGRFAPSVEVGGTVRFCPLELPRKLPGGASIAVLLQGPSQWVRPVECFVGYPEEVVLCLEEGGAIRFGSWDIVRRKVN